MDSEEIEVWYLEYVSFDARLWAWTPMVQVCGSEVLAQAQMDAMLKARNKGLQCFRVTGPHKHALPTQWPT